MSDALLPDWYHDLNQKVHEVIGRVAICRQGKECVFQTDEALAACDETLAAVRVGISRTPSPKLELPQEVLGAMKWSRKVGASIKADGLSSCPAPKTAQALVDLAAFIRRIAGEEK